MQSNYRFIAVLFLMTVIICLQYNYNSIGFHQAEFNIPAHPFVALSTSSFIHVNETIKHIASIDLIYIVNLVSRQHRRTTAIAILQTLHLDAFIVPALDIHSPQVVSRLSLVNRGRLTRLELACWASHMQIWSNIVVSSHNDSWTLIFEDDVDLEMSSIDILRSFPRFLWEQPDMIYVGHCGNPPGARLFTGAHGYRIHRAINPSCTHAYAIRTRAAARLLRLLSTPTEPIDNGITRLNSDGQLLIYSIHPPLALQQPSLTYHVSDVNPVRHTLPHFFKMKIRMLIEWWQGVERVTRLKDSVLTHINRTTADRWRTAHETYVWTTEQKNAAQ
jgi:GR25 family glycosyltransferase involved in LPS biosynthesis